MMMGQDNYLVLDVINNKGPSFLPFSSCKQNVRKGVSQSIGYVPKNVDLKAWKI